MKDLPAVHRPTATPITGMAGAERVRVTVESARNNANTCIHPHTNRRVHSST